MEGSKEYFDKEMLRNEIKMLEYQFWKRERERERERERVKYDR